MVELGVDELLKVHLLSSSLRELESSARKLAIDDAKKTANKIASELDWKIGKVLEVKLYSPSSRTQSYRSHGNCAGTGGTSTSQNIGSSNYVEMSVSLTFDYTIN